MSQLSIWLNFGVTHISALSKIAGVERMVTILKLIDEGYVQ